jgi:ligand-binding SRPBCC domain-containing protein
MGRIRLETFVHAPIERVFDLARDLDFHQASLAHTRERAVGGRTAGLIGLGESVTWKARHLGFSWTLTSRITEMARPERFADAQELGPFRWFTHTHWFEPMDGGTRMIDEWEHESPFGPLGRLVDRLFLDGYMRRLLSTRNRALKDRAEAGLG